MTMFHDLRCSISFLQAGTVLVFKEPEAIKKEPQSFSVSPRNRAEPTAKKAKPQPKPPQDPNAVFPCKKCGRYFHLADEAPLELAMLRSPAFVCNSTKS